MPGGASARIAAQEDTEVVARELARAILSYSKNNPLEVVLSNEFKDVLKIIEYQGVDLKVIFDEFIKKAISKYGRDGEVRDYASNVVQDLNKIIVTTITRGTSVFAECLKRENTRKKGLSEAGAAMLSQVVTTYGIKQKATGPTELTGPRIMASFPDLSLELYAHLNRQVTNSYEEVPILGCIQLASYCHKVLEGGMLQTCIKAICYAQWEITIVLAGKVSRESEQARKDKIVKLVDAACKNPMVKLGNGEIKAFLIKNKVLLDDEGISPHVLRYAELF